MFADTLRGRNPAFLDTAASLDRDGRLPANRSRAIDTPAYVAGLALAAIGTAVLARVWRADGTGAALPG